MRPNYLVDITQKIFALIFLICSSSLAIAQNVLILYDNSPTNTNTVALKTSLQNQGFQVTISAVSESFWNNTNPSLTGFHAVIHLNGSTYATEMPIAGQTALVFLEQYQPLTYWIPCSNSFKRLNLRYRNANCWSNRVSEFCAKRRRSLRGL